MAKLLVIFALRLQNFCAHPQQVTRLVLMKSLFSALAHLRSAFVIEKAKSPTAPTLCINAKGRRDTILKAKIAELDFMDRMIGGDELSHSSSLQKAAGAGRQESQLESKAEEPVAWSLVFPVQTS